jgi:hypothetical protein
LKQAAIQEARAAISALDEVLAAKSGVERRLHDAEILVAALTSEVAALKV